MAQMLTTPPPRLVAKVRTFSPGACMTFCASSALELHQTSLRRQPPTPPSPRSTLWTSARNRPKDTELDSPCATGPDAKTRGATAWVGGGPGLHEGPQVRRHLRRQAHRAHRLPRRLCSSRFDPFQGIHFSCSAVYYESAARHGSATGAKAGVVATPSYIEAVMPS